jgi:hypothetical protein
VVAPREVRRQFFQMPTLPRVIALALVTVAACAPTPETAGFVYRLGVDTTAAASVTRTGNTLEGVHIDRVPVTTVTRWRATLRSDSVVERLERTQTRGDSVIERVVVSRAGDSTITERTRGDSVSVWRVATPIGAMPRHASSNPALLELATRRAASSGLNRLPIPAVGAEDTAPTVDTLIRVAADSFTWGATSLRVDSAGRILRMGANTERADSLDIDALVATFSGRPLGVLSPRDSVFAEIDGARIQVTYGRPWRRGREIFGALVPWDRVWRTGAGDATFFTTDGRLLIGTTTVPAGTYAVFTLPSSSGWKLILSRNIGEDAATYAPGQDFARIDMVTDTLAEPAEQLTIGVEPMARGGMFTVSWDRMTARVPVRRR